LYTGIIKVIIMELLLCGEGHERQFTQDIIEKRYTTAIRTRAHVSKPV